MQKILEFTEDGLQYLYQVLKEQNLLEDSILPLIPAVVQGKMRLSRFLKIAFAKKRLTALNSEIARLVKSIKILQGKFELYELPVLSLKEDWYRSQNFGDQKSCFVVPYARHLEKSIQPFWLSLLNAKLYILKREYGPAGRFLGLPSADNQKILYFNSYNIEIPTLIHILKKLHGKEPIKIDIHQDGIYFNNFFAWLVDLSGDPKSPFLVRCPICKNLTPIEELKATNARQLKAEGINLKKSDCWSTVQEIHNYLETKTPAVLTTDEEFEDFAFKWGFDPSYYCRHCKFECGDFESRFECEHIARKFIKKVALLDLNLYLHCPNCKVRGVGGIQEV